MSFADNISGVKRCVHFAPCATTIDYEEPQPNPLIALLDFGTEMEKSHFFRSSLMRVSGKTSNYNPKSFNPKWMSVCEAVDTGVIAVDELHDLIVEMWPYISPPTGTRWRVEQFQELVKSS